MDEVSARCMSRRLGTEFYQIDRVLRSPWVFGGDFEGKYQLISISLASPYIIGCLAVR